MTPPLIGSPKKEHVVGLKSPTESPILIHLALSMELRQLGE